MAAELYGTIDGNTQDVGVVLFTKYLVPFEVAAVMLLVAMIVELFWLEKRWMFLSQN